MGPLVLMIFGLLQSPALSSHMQDEVLITVQRNVTGVLGEDVYLHCAYTGDNVDDLLYSTWKRPESSKKKLAGYFGQKRLTSEGFSAPASPSNLTVLRQVLGLDAEGEYTCEFATEEETLTAQVSLTVWVRPDVSLQTQEGTENGTHYQSVSCTASHAKPAPHISWQINGRAPTDDIFSIQLESTNHGNGTVTLISTLRFPTHLNDQSTIVCVVQHPALPESRRMEALVQTFVVPNITMETGLVPEAGDGSGMLRVVNCTAVGGRPHPKIAWILSGGQNTLVAQEWSDDDDGDDEETFVSSVSFPAGAHEGEDLTCVVTHLKLSSAVQRTLTLPTYHLSSICLLHLNESSSAQRGADVERLHLEEGAPGTALALEVQGDVPGYQAKCTKDGSSLPYGVELVEDELMFRGPIALHYAGHYECEASFYRHRASVQLDVSIQPQFQPPSPVAPSIHVETWRELDSVVIECSALDAVPAPNVSWSLPQGLSTEIRLSVSSRNGSDSVSATSTLTLPACLPQEHRVQCQVEHLLLEGPEIKELVLPACARPKISVQSSVVREQGSVFVKLLCTVTSVRPRAGVSWQEVNNKKTGGPGIDSVMEVLGSEDEGEEADAEGLNVTVRSTLRLPLEKHRGKTLVCVVRHRSLQRPERREIQLHAPDTSVIRTFLVSERSRPLMRAVCIYSGESGGVNITWLLHDNSTLTSASSSSAHEGSKVIVNCSYEFPLALHEGRALTCLIRQQYGPVETRVLEVPKYYVSSLSVLNKTVCAPGDGVVVYRVTLQQHLTHQRILLRLHGNVPYSNTFCSRTDNAAGLQMREISALTSAMEFPMAASEREAGQYVCQSSFHHLSATVYIWVEVPSHATQHMAIITICFSTALAITLFLVITLCVFCKRRSHRPEKNPRSKRESLATLTSLMHDPRSPVLKKAALPGVRGHQCAELVSIVLVQRTTV